MKFVGLAPRFAGPHVGDVVVCRAAGEDGLEIPHGLGIVYRGLGAGIVLCIYIKQLYL